MKIYDRFTRKGHTAYRQMYSLIYPVARRMPLRKLATGTGLTAKHIVHSTDYIEAANAPAEMIELT